MRFKAVRDACEELDIVLAEKNIQRALNSNVPPSAKYTLREGQQVVLFSEKEKRWKPNLRVVKLESKAVWVNDGNRVSKLSRTHVLPQPSHHDRRGIAKLLKRLKPLHSKLQHSIFLTKVLEPNDPRGTDGSFDEAMAKEIVGLLENCLLYTSPSPRDQRGSRMPSSA